jgi:hypothetical protein
MGLGNILSIFSPAAGAITGQGIGKALPYLSPAFGIATGKGIGDLLGGGAMGGLGGILAMLLSGHHGGGQPDAPMTPPVTAPPFGGFGVGSGSFNPLGNGQDQNGPRISPFGNGQNLLGHLGGFN